MLFCLSVSTPFKSGCKNQQPDFPYLSFSVANLINYVPSNNFQLLQTTQGDFSPWWFIPSLFFRTTNDVAIAIELYTVTEFIHLAIGYPLFSPSNFPNITAWIFALWFWSRLICSWSLVPWVRILGWLGSIGLLLLLFLSTVLSGIFSNTKFKGIISLTILLFQIPAFTSIDCHREYHGLRDSDHWRYRYIKAFDYFLQDLCIYCTKC